MCSDPLREWLNDFGYSVVRLPRADLEPLALLERSDRRVLRRFGTLGRHLAASAEPPPEISRDRRVADLSGQRTQALKLDVGLELLGAAIGALGGKPARLRAAYERAKTLSLQLSDVREDTVAPADVDLYLSVGEAGGGSAARRLAEEDRLFVVTSTLKCSAITVEAARSDGAAPEVSLPELQGIVGAGVKVSAENATRSIVTYQGSEPLVFAFQAVQLFYEAGRYVTFKPAQGKDLYALPEEERHRRYLVEDELLDVVE